MKTILISIPLFFTSLFPTISVTASPEFVLAKYMKAKSSNDYCELKSYFPRLTKKDFEYFSKPEKYEILKSLEIGKNLKVIHGFKEKDIILKVQELKPDEVIFYIFRREGETWKLLGFEVDTAFEEHLF